MADPAQQAARAHALALYENIASTYGQDPKRWASTEGTAHAVGRVALPYSLEQLSDWLARGGMALGAPAPCACTVVCVLH